VRRWSIGWVYIVEAAATLVLHFAADFPWFFAALAAFVGWPLLGAMLTAEDDLPGGWSNPDGTETPQLHTAQFWRLILLGTAISMIVGAIDAGFITGTGQAFTAVATACGVIALVAFRNVRKT
jgi:hypothetical protein